MRRLKACDVSSDLDVHRPTLELMLKPLAQSGDESCHELGRNVYRTTTLKWRAKVAVPFLRMLDYIYLSTRFQADGRAKRGAFPLQKFDSGRPETRNDNCPVGLPINLVDEEWLRLQTKEEVRRLKLRPAVSFELTDAMTRFVFLIPTLFCI